MARSLAAWRRICATTLLIAAGLAPPAHAQQSADVTFNQSYVESVQRERSFEVTDLLAVFNHVFERLPDRVKVYPTENYYYFSFGHRGVVYSGNLRLDVKDRDEGIIHFAYFNQSEPWNTELISRYKPLSLVDGVKVEKLGNLLYQVTAKNKQVVFELNDLAAVVPPPEAVGEGETFIGPVFDESGIRFFLMFHRQDKRFSFVLDETAPKVEELVTYSPSDPDILLGTRTGFAFYRDRFRERKLLVGVYQGNVENNNYFDGPFDQLPDNFLRGDELKDAIVTIHPDLKDEIDRFGNFKEQDGRFLVNPYSNYSFLNELEAYRRCASSTMPRQDFYKCLQPPDQQ